MSRTEIRLDQIVNVGVVKRRSGTSYKSVHNLLAGITAEYIENSIKPEHNDDLYRELEMFFRQAYKPANEWLVSLRPFDSLNDFLDLIFFREDEDSYKVLSSRIFFIRDSDASFIRIGELEFPSSNRFIRICNLDNQKFALVYSQVGETPVYKVIAGPGPKNSYKEETKPIFRDSNGSQVDPDGTCLPLVDPEQFFQLTDDLRKVDKDQKAAISANCDHNLLIVAGAGSGKTRSLVGRMCYLHLVKRIPLNRIAMLTFTRKAAQKLIKSASEQLTESYGNLGITASSTSINASTIDAFFKRLIEIHWSEMGFTKNPKFSFDMKLDTKLNILSRIIEEDDFPLREENGGRNENGLEKLKVLRAQIENYANGLTVNIPGIDNLLRSYVDWQVRNNEIVEFFCASCIVKNTLDNNEAFKNRLCESFECILIDEFQDINKLQNEIFAALYDTSVHFTLVGDDDQTIYTWRGSDVDIIRDMQKDENVNTVFLTVNYRNNPYIVRAGNSILRRMGERSKNGVEITPYQNTGEKVRICRISKNYAELANEVSKIYDPSKDGDSICILSRKSKCHGDIQKALEGMNIPSVIIGSRPDSDISSGYKALKAMTFIACRSNVKANYDLLNELAEGRYSNMELKSFITGVKPFTADESGSLFRVEYMVKLFEYLDITLHPAADFEEMVSNYCRAYACIVENDTSEDRVVQDPCLSSFMDYVSENDWMYPEIGRNVLTSIFSRFERRYLANEQNRDARTNDVNTVLISSIHSSKGLEYDDVFVVELDEKSFPNTKIIDSEYDELIRKIEDLRLSEKKLGELRSNTANGLYSELISECDTAGFQMMGRDDIESLKEELEDVRDDVLGFTADGIEEYRNIYDAYIRPEIESYKDRLHRINLNKRATEETYHGIEEKLLTADSIDRELESQLQSVSDEISDIDSQIGSMRTEFDGFLRSISHLESMNALCSTAKQYLLDIDHLTHQEQLRNELRKMRDEMVNEELRSFYVSISRARKLLYLCSTLGSCPSKFLDILDREDCEDYELTTRSEDEQMRSLREFKKTVDVEMAKPKPDLEVIDKATAQMMSSTTDDMKAGLESNVNEFLLENPDFKKLTGGSRTYLVTALNLDYLGKTTGSDFNNEVLLNLMRSGEELVRSHVSPDAEQIVLDDTDMVEELHKKLKFLGRDRKTNNSPSGRYLKEQFYDYPARSPLDDFKKIALAQYVTFSGMWPEVSETYSGNWDVKTINTDPDEFINCALDLCNMRNETTHTMVDETWKNDYVPYAYNCLKTIVNTF